LRNDGSILPRRVAPFDHLRFQVSHYNVQPVIEIPVAAGQQY